LSEDSGRIRPSIIGVATDDGSGIKEQSGPAELNGARLGIKYEMNALGKSYRYSSIRASCDGGTQDDRFEGWTEVKLMRIASGRFCYRERKGVERSAWPCHLQVLPTLGLEIVEANRVRTAGQPYLSGLFRIAAMDAVIIDDDTVGDIEAAAVVRSEWERVFPFGRDIQSAGELDGVIAASAGDLQIELVAGKISRSGGGQGFEIWESLKCTAIDRVLEVSHARAGTVADVKQAFHAEGMAGQSADKRIGAGFGGSIESNRLPFLRVQDFAMEDGGPVFRDELSGLSFGTKCPRLLGIRKDPGAGLCQDEVMLHFIVIDEDEFDGFTGSDFESIRFIAHFSGYGADDDFPCPCGAG